MTAIYFDANAGVAAVPIAVDAYRSAAELFANPSSGHSLGRRARDHLEVARARIAGHLGVEPSELRFTSGGTESDALAIMGAIGAAAEPGHVVTTSVEHPAVAQTLAALEAAGRITVSRIGAGRGGRVDATEVLEAIRPETRLVTVVAACNETGVLQPMREIGDGVAARRTRGQAITFHTDAVQAVGRVRLDLARWGVDLLSLSGHKLGAVGGIGALVVRRGTTLSPVLSGGGQEQGLRAGTENVAGAASLAAAFDVLPERVSLGRTLMMRDRLEASLLGSLGDLEIMGASEPRLLNTSCVCFSGCEGDGIMMALDVAGVAVSTGSACSSGSVDPSPILLGMGLTPVEARSCVRFSLVSGADDVDEGVVDRVAALTASIVTQMRG